MQIVDVLNSARGRARAHLVPPAGAILRPPPTRSRRILRQYGDVPHHWVPASAHTHNDILYSWGSIVGNALIPSGPRYTINGMYIEFANVADPEEPVTVPAFTRADGISYYNALADSAEHDYLRVGIIASTLTSSDETLFPDGNTLTVFAQTVSGLGRHGKQFAAGSNSVVIGGALIAMVAEGDPTQDLLLSRFYFPEEEQQLKLPPSQIGIEWDVIWE